MRETVSIQQQRFTWQALATVLPVGSLTSPTLLPVDLHAGAITARGSIPPRVQFDSRAECLARECSLLEPRPGLLRLGLEVADTDLRREVSAVALLGPHRGIALLRSAGTFHPQAGWVVGFDAVPAKLQQHSSPTFYSTEPTLVPNLFHEGLALTVVDFNRTMVSS